MNALQPYNDFVSRASLAGHEPVGQFAAVVASGGFRHRAIGVQRDDQLVILIDVGADGQEDAADVDGYGHLRFLVFVVIPLSRAAIATLAVFAFVQAWNQYLWPLLVTNDPNMRTVQIGIAALQEEQVQRTNVVLAGTVIAFLPMLILVIAFQRFLVRGLTAGAVKG